MQAGSKGLGLRLDGRGGKIIVQAGALGGEEGVDEVKVAGQLVVLFHCSLFLFFYSGRHFEL